jgi:redox-sensing transcriptional repressor
MAVLAVPSAEAQGIAARLAKAGVRAILDFSTAPLRLPAHVTVRRMNVALELEVLSHALAGG